MHHRNTALAAALSLALLAGCKQDTASPGNAGSTASGMQAVIDQVAQDGYDAGAMPDGNAPLKPGQGVQGTIEADVGKGTQSFRSLSTKVADDIAEQVDEKLGTGEGRRAIDEANRKLEKMGTGAQVSAEDVRGIVGGLAGKTFFEAQLQKIDIINTLQAGLTGNANDGSQLTVNLGFDDASLAFNDASLTYRPKAASMFDFYESKDVQVTIDRFERNADGTYALVGSFTAGAVPASALSKNIKGQSLASVSGRFDYAALPVKDMPKFGP